MDKYSCRKEPQRRVTEKEAGRTKLRLSHQGEGRGHQRKLSHQGEGTNAHAPAREAPSPFFTPST
jgi:hypothetical protein